MVLKTAPLTKHDLEFIKWTIWEPLRRNQYYKNDYAKLKVEGHLLDQDKTPEFCEKWKLSGPIDPAHFSDMSLEHKISSHGRISGFLVSEQVNSIFNYCQMFYI